MVLPLWDMGLNPLRTAATICTVYFPLEEQVS